MQPEFQMFNNRSTIDNFYIKNNSNKHFMLFFIIFFKSFLFKIFVIDKKKIAT